MTDGGEGARVRAVLHDQRVGEGTGLGLAAVYGFVKQSSGASRWTRRSAGNDVQVYLPVTEDEAPVPEAVAAAGPMPGGPKQFWSLRTRWGFGGSTQIFLRRLGYKVLVAANAVQAAGRGGGLRAGRVLLLTGCRDARRAGGCWPSDLRVPVTRRCGWYTCQGTRTTRCVRHGIATDRVNFLAKPFTYASLASKVREALDTDEGRGEASTTMRPLARRVPILRNRFTA